jgi:signal transduction histidine kinase
MALRQAVDNVLSNALRYAPAGTAIEVRLARAGDAWRLTVRDFGPGIPPAELQQVFAPFHRLDRGGGAGLGLAIVAEVLRDHGGSAEAQRPEHGSGALVVLTLPVAP